jgi:hypothetical protein
MYLMTLTRAQRQVIDRLTRDSLVPANQRNAGHFRLHGRGMERTLVSLEQHGLITYSKSPTNSYFYAYLKGVKIS